MQRYNVSTLTKLTLPSSAIVGQGEGAVGGGGVEDFQDYVEEKGRIWRRKDKKEEGKGP